MAKPISSFREIDLVEGKRTLILCDIDETLLTWDKKSSDFYNEVSKTNINTSTMKLILLAHSQYTTYRCTVPPKATDIEGFCDLLSRNSTTPGSKLMFLTARTASHHTADDFKHLGLEYKYFDVHYTANKISKGEYIKRYINLSKYDDVIFIDDQPNYIHSVLLEVPVVRCYLFAYDRKLLSSGVKTEEEL